MLGIYPELKPPESSKRQNYFQVLCKRSISKAGVKSALWITYTSLPFLPHFLTTGVYCVFTLSLNTGLGSGDRKIHKTWSLSLRSLQSNEEADMQKGNYNTMN